MARDAPRLEGRRDGADPLARAGVADAPGTVEAVSTAMEEVVGSLASDR